MLSLLLWSLVVFVRKLVLAVPTVVVIHMLLGPVLIVGVKEACLVAAAATEAAPAASGGSRSGSGRGSDSGQ